MNDNNNNNSNNKRKIKPGPRGAAKSAKTSYDSFHLFFTNEIIEKIVKYTNQTIEPVLKRFSELLEQTNKYTHMYLVDSIGMEALI